MPTKGTTKPRVIRADAETTPKKTKETVLPKRPSEYSKPLNKLKTISALLGAESELVKQLLKVKKLKRTILTRRNAKGAIGPEDFNKYAIRRLDDIEMNLQKLKNNLRARNINNHTNEIAESNITDKLKSMDEVGNNKKDMKQNVVRLIAKTKDFNKKEPTKKHIDEISTLNINSTIKDTTYSEPTVTSKHTAKTTVIEDRNIFTTKDTNYNNETKVTASAAKVTDATNPKDVMTAATAEVTLETMSYAEPAYDNDDPLENHDLTYSQMAELDDMIEKIEN